MPSFNGSVSEVRRSSSRTPAVRLQPPVHVLIGVCDRPPVVLSEDVAACGVPEALAALIVPEYAKEPVRKLLRSRADE